MSSPHVIRVCLSLDKLKRFCEDCNQLALLLIDDRGMVVSGSPALSRSLGYAWDQIKGQPMYIMMNGPASVHSLIDKQAESLDGQLPVVMLRPASGSAVASRYRVEELQGDDGERYYMVSFNDLYSGMNLNLLQLFAGMFMKDINLGVLLIDMSFNLVDISDTACRILGIDRNESLNRSLDEIFSRVPVEHQLVNRSILDGVIVRNHAVSWTNANERYDLLLDSNLIKNAEGQTVGAYIMFKDVTNLRSLEEQVRRSDRLAMIGQIAAGTAHEIRNPLTSIKGFMQVLRNTFTDRGMEKEERYIDIVLAEINRINELVSEFLLLSKRKDVSYHEVDMDTTLREILPIIHNEAILHGVNVHYKPTRNLPAVIADRELLKQVLLNISKNGIEAMTDGGTLTVSVRADEEERNVLIDIHDTGPGIPGFLIDKIFDPFFTTKENGTGLGLSVCQRIIHDMGGTIRVSSKGYGTTFTVYVPYP